MKNERIVWSQRVEKKDDFFDAEYYSRCGRKCSTAGRLVAPMGGVKYFEIRRSMRNSSK